MTADSLSEATEIASPRGKRQSAAPPLAGMTMPTESMSRITGLGSRSSTYAESAQSPEEAMFYEEVARTRTFALMSIMLNIVGLGTVPFLGGHAMVGYVLMGGLGVCLFQSVWNYIALKDPRNYTLGTTLVMAWTATITGYLAIIYIGVFSPAPALVVLGVYFFGRSQFGKAAASVLAIGIVCQVTFTILFAGGFLPDPGLFTGADRPLYVIAVVQSMTVLLYVTAFWLARSTRDGSLRAMRGLVAARRAVAAREAQFQEVRQQLDRALEAGGAGRYTDQTFGDYRLGAVIGRGAMGEVYEASHVTSGEPAAVKLLHESVLQKPDSVERFLREARAASALESPHVVRVLAAGQAPLPYIVMEKLDGHDLAYYLRKKRRFPAEQLIELLRQIGGVVDMAAQKSIVHRDLKPNNLFLAEQARRESVWKILDFGASKLGEHSGTLTEGRVVGTPGYMAPEQACGEDVDSAADRYALAAIAYRCLTGRPPFSGRDLPGILFKVVHAMPPRPSTLGAIPLEVDSVLAVAMAKRAEDRFDTAAEFVDALAAALAGRHDDWMERRAEALLADLEWGARGRRDS